MEGPLLEEKSSPRGVEWLWSPITVRMYLSLMARSSCRYSQEAALGALQNATAGSGTLSQAMAHTIVKKEGGLHQLKKILQADECEEVKKTALSLLRNVSRYEELHSDIAQQILPDLVRMLPEPDSEVEPPGVTISLCNILLSLCQNSTQNARAVVNLKGLRKLVSISGKSFSHSEWLGEGGETAAAWRGAGASDGNVLVGWRWSRAQAGDMHVGWRWSRAQTGWGFTCWVEVDQGPGWRCAGWVEVEQGPGCGNAGWVEVEQGPGWGCVSWVEVEQGPGWLGIYMLGGGGAGPRLGMCRLGGGGAGPMLWKCRLGEGGAGPRLRICRLGGGGAGPRLGMCRLGEGWVKVEQGPCCGNAGWVEVEQGPGWGCVCWVEVEQGPGWLGIYMLGGGGAGPRLGMCKLGWVEVEQGPGWGCAGWVEVEQGPGWGCVSWVEVEQGPGWLGIYMLGGGGAGPRLGMCRLGGGGAGPRLWKCRHGPNRQSQAASTVLQAMWRHNELHGAYRKAGYKKSAFINSRTVRSLSPVYDKEGGQTL
ncbi:hypothetical protein JZ751_025583 [Albula glossodonta]|uniref:Uncharacterized protein n=1 Tax=Albula glossodonta TaxID=121402 RepID=A0A8T2NQ91_9TELE|nr:hypothetical protein JZ751_025583 [Albula glossodonta]